MRLVRVLIPLVIGLAACGGEASDSPPTTPATTASPSPSIDLAEEARHSTCLDFARAQRPLVSSADIGKELGDAMDEFANELGIDAGLYADAGDQETSALVTRMSADARATAPELRAESDGNAALSRYSSLIDELLGRLGPGACEEEIGE